ncbi:deoxynucleotidyltransferase terminal-interacting protein 2 [Orussus abietinus]|uniref:deoxynucleotidyltransferase terminal-interacting protein 2 n=1 Tax=Orussus abietinus TaxID=222816 RepID=UPI000625D5E8|nr:deoxynucleotidyltransferase terminal-interacting protein 2 [Orussus abietinus]
MMDDTTMDIIIDTRGQPELLTKDKLIESDVDSDINSENEADEDDHEFDDADFDPTKLKIKKFKEKKKQFKSTNNDIDLDEFETEMGWKNRRRIQPKNAINVIKVIKDISPIEKILEKSAIKPGFEQLECVPRYDESMKRLRAQRRREREKTKGKAWFNLPATEVTEEVKRDLEIIQMRSVLDPKRFYKKNDLKVIPKYFQIGKVVDSPLDYYNGRLTKKERKRTIVDELMADAEFSKYNKRKYKEIIDEKKKLQYKAHKHAKRLKKGKKK